MKARTLKCWTSPQSKFQQLLACHTLAVLMIRRGLISASRSSASVPSSPESSSISCMPSGASTLCMLSGTSTLCMLSGASTLCMLSSASTPSSPSMSSVIKSVKSPPEKISCCCFCLSSWPEETLLVSLSCLMLVSKYRPQLLFWGVSGLLLLDLIVFLVGWWSLHVDCCGHSPVASKTGHV